MMKQSLAFELSGPAESPTIPSQVGNTNTSFKERPFLLGEGFGLSEPQISMHNTQHRPTSHDRDDQQIVACAYTKTDTFLPETKWPSGFAVASQICTLRSSVGADPILSTVISPQTCNIVLPSSAELTNAIRIGLFELNCYFPSLHTRRVIEAISAALKEMGYRSLDQSLAVTASHHLLTSVLLILIAYGQLLDPQASPDSGTSESWPGSQYYWQSRKLIQHFEGYSKPQATCVIYYAISAAYLLSSERLQASSTHLLHGLHSAISIGLARGRLSTAPSEDLADPLALWVMLDFLDKRITQKCGIPYFLRNNIENLEIEKEPSAQIDDSSKEYLKTMVAYNKLWASIWDGFLAPNAPMAGDWVEIQVLDARVLALKEQIPRELSWGAELIGDAIANGVTDTQMRRRLTIFLASLREPYSSMLLLTRELQRYQSLRLNMRHRTLEPQELNVQRVESCLVIVAETLNALDQYLENWGVKQNSGYIITSALVEAIYYITLGYREGIPVMNSRTLSATLAQAGNMLKTLSNTIMSAARAFEALRCVLEFNFDALDLEYSLMHPFASFSEATTGFNIPMPQNVDTNQGERFRSSSNVLFSRVGKPATEYLTHFDSLLADIVPDVETDQAINTRTAFLG